MEVSTLAGSRRGASDGLTALFNFPRGITFNPHDNCLYVCDYGNHMIRKVTLSG